MTDIPAFTGGGGLSTLILRQVETRKTAFVMVRDCEKSMINRHLACCNSFCRSVGACQVYAAFDGQPLLPDEKPAYKMLLLKRDVSVLEAQAPKSTPLSNNNAQSFADIYNACFSQMVSSREFTLKDAKSAISDDGTESRLYLSGQSFAAITLVKFQGDAATLQVIAVLPQCRGGFGSAVLKDVINRAADRGEKKLFAEVMSTNTPAMKMYEKMGFMPDKKLSTWYLLD